MYAEIVGRIETSAKDVVQDALDFVWRFAVDQSQSTGMVAATLVGKEQLSITFQTTVLGLQSEFSILPCRESWYRHSSFVHAESRSSADNVQSN